jgi:hypothetical protein
MVVNEDLFFSVTLTVLAEEETVSSNQRGHMRVKSTFLYVQKA